MRISSHQNWFAWGLLAPLALANLVAVYAERSSRPNILFILVDDLGWSDLGCYGHPWHQTPQIDRLAKEGMRFTQAYASAPICSASRASLLTGKTTARLGFEFVVKESPGRQVILPPQSLKAPPFTLSLDLAETTVAEQLRETGYDTAYFGKWHLNPHYNGVYNGWSPTEGPGQQGFSTAIEDFGSHPYSRKELAVIEEEGLYHPDGITDRANGFIQQNHSSPFFLMVSHFYVHTPVKSPYAWLRRKYDALLPQGIKNREKRVEYAAFVETLDHYVGQLLDGLKKSGNHETTLVVFMSDNGGHPEYVSNGPLRGSKWNLYEGGIRVPFLVRWPGKVEAGSLCDQPIVGYDLFETFSEIAEARSNPGKSTGDGSSIFPLLVDPTMERERALYWHFPYYHPEGAKFGAARTSIGLNDFEVSQTRPHSVIRRGNYKLIFFDEGSRVELYDLSKDPSEQTDLSLNLPEMANDLKAALFRYFEDVKARRALPLNPESK